MVSKVVSAPTADVAEDFSLVQMTFPIEGGQTLTLSFPMAVFEAFVSGAGQIVMTAQSQTGATTGHLGISAVAVAEAAAGAPVGGGKVILSVRSSNNIPMHLAMAPEIAERLRPELHRAAKSARKQASKSRH